MMDKHIAVLEDIRKEYAAYDNAHHQLVALDAAIALMRGQSWHDIATAPKNEPVLVFLAGQQFVAWLQDDATDPWHEEGEAASDWNRMWLVTDNRNGPYPLRGGKPTHWQPLPAPPKDPADE